MSDKPQHCRAFSVSIALLIAAGCSSTTSGPRLRVGTEPSADGGLGAAVGNAGNGGTHDSGIAVGANALNVHVEDIKKMTITIVTLQCAGDCADVEAVAHGGHAPYAFKWDDGSKTAKRHVCPTAGTLYTVSATDTAIAGGEFPYLAHTANAEVTAQVLRCTDAAVADAGPAGGVCVQNPSFEGTAQLNAGLFDLKPWNDCSAHGGTPDVVNQNTLPFSIDPLPPPTDGATFLRMAYDPANGAIEFVTQNVCAPLLADHAYAFTIDAARANEQGGPAQLAVYASAVDCTLDHLLWTSPMLANTWTTFCVAFTPKAEANYLVLAPAAPDKMTGTTVLIDHLVPVDHCP